VTNKSQSLHMLTDTNKYKYTQIHKANSVDTYIPIRELIPVMWV